MAPMGSTARWIPDERQNNTVRHKSQLVASRSQVETKFSEHNFARDDSPEKRIISIEVDVIEPLRLTGF